MNGGRYLVVTLDTEVDKDPSWRISDPVSFESVCRGIPETLSPLFDQFGVVPTYLLSGEVIEDPACVSVLRALGDRAELGTHLHGDFVSPERRLNRDTMAGRTADSIQPEYSRELEYAKLRTLTDLFRSAFGYQPTSFRAGRFALSPSTLELLAWLGYQVDSSVTPGMRWRYPQATLDYLDWTSAPARRSTPHGEILELPVGVQVRNSALTDRISRLPPHLQSVARRIVGAHGRVSWLRPSWTDGPQLVEYVERSPDRVLVLMLHSMEIIAGASPYAATENDVRRITTSLRQLFEYCVGRGFQFCGLSQAASYA